MEVKVLAEGKFAPDDLAVTLSDSTRKINSEIESQVDALWEAELEKAKREGRVCFNGTSYRLNALTQEENKLRLDFGLLEFKARRALPTIPGYKELPEEYYHKGCYNGATVKTSDGKYLVVELSGKSMNHHKVDMLGGLMEKPSEIHNGQDVFECLYTELREEGCISKSDISDIYLCTIFLAPSTNVCFYFEVALNVSSDALLERFAKEADDQDISALKVLTRDEYVAFLSNPALPVKMAIAKNIGI